MYYRLELKNGFILYALCADAHSWFRSQAIDLSADPLVRKDQLWNYI